MFISHNILTLRNPNKKILQAYFTWLKYCFFTVCSTLQDSTCSNILIPYLLPLRFFSLIKSIPCFAGARSQTQRILFSKDATDERAYHECKNQLEALHKIFQSAQTSKAKESAITLIKDQIEKFIEDLLSAGLVISKVESQLDDLCFKDAAVPSVLLEWVKAEFEYRIKQVTNRRAVCKESTCTELPRPEPVQLSLFDKDTLYHAGLCCEAVSTCQNMKDLRNFFCSKSPMHNFKEFSLSEKALVKPYLVIKEGRKIYVAFKSSTFISEFNKVGYDEGIYSYHSVCTFNCCVILYIAMKSQANQMPIRFFTELLWNNYNVVLTGKLILEMQ